MSDTSELPFQPSLFTLPRRTPRKLTRAAVRFTQHDLERARCKWRCTCGPVALACILDLTPDEVRPFLRDYRGWMNPTQMRNAIEAAGAFATERDRNSLYRPDGPRRNGCPIVATYGITRIQFAGPWTERGAHPADAYHHTHWVASALPDAAGCSMVFDCNWGWMDFAVFLKNMEELARDREEGTGEWWPTHIYEITIPPPAPDRSSSNG